MPPLRCRPRVKAVLLAVVCAALPGCQVWNGFLDLLKWPTGPAGESPAPLVLVAAPNPGVAPDAATPMMPRVMLYRIVLPVGGFSGNARVWSQLNEDAIDASTAVLLAQNGLRAATGSVGRWPEIAKLVDPSGTSNQPVIIQTDGRSAINLPTRQNIAELYVSAVDRDRRLRVRQFERCDSGFRLAVRGVRNKAEIQVQLEPIVTLGTIQIARSGMGFTNAGITAEESFDDLSLTANLSADKFLVVSALNPKPGSLSVGTQWLTNPDQVPATETVLVFVPAPASAK
jgi:hypothetical protein